MTAATPFWLGVDAAAYELPGDKIDLRAWATEFEPPAQQVDAIIESGSRYFHVAPDIGEVELAVRAVAKLADAKRFASGDIGAVIHVHTQPYSVPSAPRSLPLEIASAFGIRPLWAGSIAHLKCVSTTAGLAMLRALMTTYPQLNAGLIVSVDRVYGEKYRLRQMGGIQCDGAACLLVTRNSTRNRIGGIAVQNYAPKWYRGPDAVAKVEEEIISYEYLYASRILREAVRASGVPLSEFGRLLPHNSDVRGWRSLCRAMRIPEDRLFIDNIGRVAHACCSDFAINLVDEGFAALERREHIVAVQLSNMGAFGAITLHPPAGAEAAAP
jgi:3-oxoacyl-[acyl-carrier-protein] synthase III